MREDIIGEVHNHGMKASLKPALAIRSRFAGQTSGTRLHPSSRSSSRDGHPVYVEQHGAVYAIARVSLDTRKVDEIVSLDKLKRTGTNGSFWFGMAPDDAPIVLRDTGTQEIYALEWEAR